MKNKKILNVCLLALSLFTLITFILPISKIAFSNTLMSKIIYYVTSGIMLAGLASVVVITIINLFKDEYKNLKIVEGFIFITFAMVFINLILFASINNVTINLGYILVSAELFIATMLSQVIRLFQSKSEFKTQLKELLVNPKAEERKNEKAIKKANKQENKKQKQENNKQHGFTVKQNAVASSEAASEVRTINEAVNLKKNSLKHGYGDFDKNTHSHDEEM